MGQSQTDRTGNLDSTPVGDLSKNAGQIQQWAAQRLHKDQMNPAKTPNPDARATFGLGVLRDMAGDDSRRDHSDRCSGDGCDNRGAGNHGTRALGARRGNGAFYRRRSIESRRSTAAVDGRCGICRWRSNAAGQGFTQPTLSSNALRRAVPGGSVSASSVNAVPPAAAMQPALANTPDQILNYAAQKGIDLTPAEATGSPAAATVQALGERSLAGSRCS